MPLTVYRDQDEYVGAGNPDWSQGGTSVGYESLDGFLKDRMTRKIDLLHAIKGELNPDLAPQMARLGMDEDEKLAVVFFLMTLTDPRVAHERAPFDHPSLVVVNGYEKVDSEYSEKTIGVKSVGAGGRSGIPHSFPSGDDSEHEPRAAAQP